MVIDVTPTYSIGYEIALHLLHQSFCFISYDIKSEGGGVSPVGVPVEISIVPVEEDGAFTIKVRGVTWV